MSNQNKSEATTIQAEFDTSPLAIMERAQIDLQISTARRYPRDLGQIKKKMLSFATLDQETAESCFYVLPRGGKRIEGPSVRLAEIAVSCYQHIRAGARILGNDGKKITVQAVCHDLENNVCVSVEVDRRITDKEGRTFSEDMQVVAANAARSIAFRNAVFKVVPMALVKPVYEEAKRVAVGDAKTLSSRRDKAIEAFSKMSVTKEMILDRLGKTDVDGIDLKDLETLLGLHTALKEGDTSIDEAFPKQPAKPVYNKSNPFDGSKAEPTEPTKPSEAQGTDPRISLMQLIGDSSQDELRVENFLRSKGIMPQSMGLATISDAKVKQIINNWPELLREMNGMGGQV